jgi:long-chain acyl-CoA synthetase
VQSALSGFPFFHIAGLFFCMNAFYLAWEQILVPNPRDTDFMCEKLIKYRPSWLISVPALCQLLMKNPKFKTIDFSQLDGCVTAASPFPEESQREFEKIIGKNRIIECYGMTETSPLSCMNPYRGQKKLGSVGLPVPNTFIKLINHETGKEVGIGEPGEICVKGPQVMKEYYFNPEETKFVIDKYGYMHTGDVGIFDEDGYLKIVDRLKDMIIVGGFKVFSSKIEDIIVQHPKIASAAVVGVPNPERPGSEIVRAYVTLRPDIVFDGNDKELERDLIRFLSNKCAPYEIPKDVKICAELPLTTVGKVDKKVLRKQAREGIICV